MEDLICHQTAIETREEAAVLAVVANPSTVPPMAAVAVVPAIVPTTSEVSVTLWVRPQAVASPG